MTLSDRERETLAELAADLGRSDPRLAHILTGSPARVVGRWWWAAVAVLAAAVALILLAVGMATAQLVPALIGIAAMMWVWLVEVAFRLVRHRRRR